MTRPTDARAFVESVERATNERLSDAVYEIFAPNARSVMISDGAREESVGVEAIHDSWARTCAAFRARRFRVEKHLVAATDDTIVNEWRGGPGGRRDGCGIEIWRFDCEGRVIDQRLYGYLKVRSAVHPIQALQLLLGSPGMALAFGWARLRRR
ncbi:hypothetical protein A5707_13375 [Mycobacterium kyorinense]|uniref:SnoaL-like domain-containing protein n=1 Tax=Mycobacterium kyorinense TaxID=487514 RepID=A0A1A2ZRK9_9MYCO|nr:nuclear transport factor 2 family protein [Mycobacterium kyorinense]OBI51701.1 hypothetical protein A5707_13375 [Mycobacterium kyorinense]